MPHGQQVDRALELARTICENAPLGIRATKQAARTFVESGEQAAIDEIPRVKEQVFGSEDFGEGIQSFVERRSAEFTGR